MKTFELTQEQAEEVREYIKGKTEDFNLLFVSVTLVKTNEENVYFIKTCTIPKEFEDTSFLMDDANATQRILNDTESYIYNEIYK